MTKIDTIIAVKDVQLSAKWYGEIFDCRNAHGGDHFAVLISNDDNEILLCLHQWGTHEHPTMTDPTITPGNGLLLYFRTNKMKTIRKNIDKMGGIVEEEIHLNPNSEKMEFSLRDPDGYYLMVTEFHEYEG